MKTLAIITARGGSKRIPRKNIKPFMGKPMIAYAIEAARKSGVFQEVMVSTEDEEIARIAEEWGAKVPFFRSTETASDYATTADVIDEVLRVYRERGMEFDSFCCIYPCVPFLTDVVLKEAYEEFLGADALIPVCPFSQIPEWAFTICDGILVPKYPEMANVRSQDIPPSYSDPGMFYYSTTESFARTRSVVPSNVRPYVMDEIHCQDIDNDIDWKMAELKFRFINE